jgi:hypothetical protein
MFAVERWNGRVDRDGVTARVGTSRTPQFAALTRAQLPPAPAGSAARGVGPDPKRDDMFFEPMKLIPTDEARFRSQLGTYCSACGQSALVSYRTRKLAGHS